MHIFVNKINQCLCHVSEYQSVSEKNSHRFLLCVVAFEYFWVLFFLFLWKSQNLFQGNQSIYVYAVQFFATNHKDF